MNESEFFFSSMTPKKNTKNPKKKLQKKRPSFLVVKKLHGKGKTYKHTPRIQNNSIIVISSGSESSFSDVNKPQHMKNSDNELSDYQSCEEEFPLQSVLPKIDSPSLKDLNEMENKYNKKTSIENWVKDVNSKRKIIGNKEDTVLSYENFANNGERKNIINSTAIDLVKSNKDNYNNLLKMDKNFENISDSFSSDSEDSNKSMKELLDELYGTAWRENKHKIMPKSEKKVQIKQNLLQKNFNSERKPVKSNFKDNFQVKECKNRLCAEFSFANPEIPLLKTNIKPQKLLFDFPNEKKNNNLIVKTKTQNGAKIDSASNNHLGSYKSDTSEESAKNNPVIKKLLDKKKVNTNKKKEHAERKKISELTERLNILCNENKLKSKITSTNITKHTFLSSLSKNVPENECDFSAKIFRNNFKEYKEQLTQRLFKIFNEQVFNNELSEEKPVEWSGRMLNTAGYCRCKKVLKNGEIIRREAYIVLSSKVVDSADRLRDTLIHEMCHAATWIINKVSNGHGVFWKSWASKAMKKFPELPPIKVCHDYAIKTKYTYKCTECGYSFGRHKKSLDLEKKRCGHCLGKFEVLLNKTNKNGEVKTVASTPRKPNEFALFVKENYGKIKSTSKAAHKDVMKELAEQFKQAKIKD